MTTLEDWIKTVPVPALKAFAQDMPGSETAKRAKVEAFVLSDPESRAVAEESMAIAQEALRGR